MGMPAFIVDPIVRRKSKLHETPLDRYEVRIAKTVEDYEDAFRLLHIIYVFQGLESLRGRDMRMTKQHVLPESTVLVAWDQGTIVGTMTITLDSPAGLPLEENYGAEIETLRKEGAKIVEYGSLAVVRRCWHTGVTTLLNMAAHFFSINMLEATHCIAGVVPGIAPYYRAMFEFSPLGQPKRHAELETPVMGMVQNMLSVTEHFRKHFKRPMATGQLPLEHFVYNLPDCIKIPTDISLEDLARWKMPRDVFLELFVKRTDRLATLDKSTFRQLRRMRTDETVVPGLTGDKDWRIDTDTAVIHIESLRDSKKNGDR